MRRQTTPITTSTIQETVKIIRDFLRTTANHPLPLGLMEGKAGIMVFMAAYANAMPEVGTTQIEHHVEEINTKWKQGLTRHTLSEGTAGIFWSKLYLEEMFPNQLHLFTDKTAELDLLKRKLNSFLNNNNLDYLHGATGIIKVLSSYQLLTQSEIDLILEHFRKQAIPTQKGISWETNFYSEKPSIEIGLAHGVSAIINTLGELSNQKINDALIKPSILDLYSRVTDQVAHHQPAKFQCATHNHAWCTSYLGAALILLKYLSSFGYTEQAEHIKNTVRQKLTNLNANATINDPCLCHGTTGIITMLTQLAEHHDASEINEVKQFLVEKTIALLFNGNPIKKENLNPAFTNDLSLLSGLPGIGMALLHQLQPIPFLPTLLNIN